MRRLLGGGGALVALAVLAVLALRLGDGGEDYRVDAIFDTTKGMVAGQQVKIAGTPAGSVEGVALEPGPAARMELAIDARYGPFHADASCRILPEGLLSENYVECDPGSPDRPRLTARGAGRPTVPRRQTSVPVAVQDVVDLFSAPVNARVGMLLDELGIATAGRGSDLNAILRRANPALTQANRVLARIAAQDREVADAVAQTDRILASLDRRRDGVRTFVDRSAAVLATTAPRDRALRASVRRLPPLLSALRDGARQIDRVAADAPPLLADLRAAAPGLARLQRRVEPFARAAEPALASTARTARQGRRALRATRAEFTQLRRFARDARPVVPALDATLRSLRDRGAIDGLLRGIYALGSIFAGYDEVSHMGGLTLTVVARCIVQTTAPGCRRAFTAPGAGTVPVNDPAAGPRQPGERVTGARARTAPRPSADQLRSLLDTLLK